MNCINSACDHQATPVIKFGIVVSYICEHCGRKFGISDNGQASQKEIEELQHEQMTQIVSTGTYKPLRLVISSRLEKKGNIKMLDPMHEREKTFTKYCHLRARG